MKNLVYTTVLALTLCAQATVLSAMARMEDAFVKPWKGVGKSFESMGRRMKEQLFPTASPAIDTSNIQSLMNKIADLRAELKPLAQQRGRLRSQIFAAAPTTDTALKDQIAQLGRKMGGLSGQRTKLRNRLTELFGTKHGDMPNLKARLSDLDRQLSALGSDKRSLESQFDAMLTNNATSEQAAKLTDFNKSINALGTRIRNLEAQLDQLLMGA